MRIAQAVWPTDDAENEARGDALLTGVHLDRLEPEALVEPASGIAMEYSEREEVAAASACLRLRPREQQLADALATRGSADADLLDVGLSRLRGVEAILVLSIWHTLSSSGCDVLALRVATSVLQYLHGMDGDLDEAEHLAVLADRDAAVRKALRVALIEVTNLFGRPGKREHKAAGLAAKALVVHLGEPIDQLHRERRDGGRVCQGASIHLLGRGHRGRRLIVAHRVHQAAAAQALRHFPASRVMVGITPYRGGVNTRPCCRVPSAVGVK